MLRIYMTSDKRGSNPGGNCTIPFSGKALEGYIKYATQSKLHPESPFRPQHQPIYEAITLNIASWMGLEVPKYFIIDAQKTPVQFDYQGFTPEEKLSEQRPFYFLSELVRLPEHEDTTRLHEMMAREKFYRDVLMIGDVSKKKQNHTLLKTSQGIEYVLYIDVGCNFVDAVNGVLSQRHEIERLLPPRRERHYEKRLKEKLKDARRFTDKYLLKTNENQRAVHNTRTMKISLQVILDSIPELSIPIFPYAHATISELLSTEEIEEIQALITLSTEQVMRDYKRKGKLEQFTEERHK